MEKEKTSELGVPEWSGRPDNEMPALASGYILYAYGILAYAKTL